jgi:hypothetical protein
VECSSPGSWRRSYLVRTVLMSVLSAIGSVRCGSGGEDV